MQGTLELKQWSIGPIPVVPIDESTLLVEFKGFPVVGELWGFTTRRDPDTDGVGSGMAHILEFESLLMGLHRLKMRSIIDGTELEFILEVEQ